MRNSWTVALGCLALAATACNGNAEQEQEPEAPANTMAEDGIAEPPTDNAALQEPPPMIVRSPAYRCDDGAALYVDVLTDTNAVTVRDSRVDTPVLLDRDEPESPFTGDGRTLSGTGDEVRYSSPDRPDQTCRVAPE